MPLQTHRCTLPVLATLAMSVLVRGEAAQDKGPGGITTVPAPHPPTLQEAANASYAGIYADKSVTLREGRWDGERLVPDGASRPAVGLVQDFSLNGDLDGDGRGETVVFLWESSGGSGTFNYLAVLARRERKVVNLGTAPLGDRVQLRAGRIRGGRIELDVVQAGPGDAACCPGQTATRVWSLQTDGLREDPALATGSRSLADLAGVEWVLTEFSSGEPVPADAQVTLRFDDQRISGKSACNRYFAEVQTGEMPGDLSVGEIAGTRMACPEKIMSVENRYLQALRNTTRHGFLSGTLALTWQHNGTLHTMRFSPHTPQE
jgi:heat shock protein HslJ